MRYVVQNFVGHRATIGTGSRDKGLIALNDISIVDQEQLEVGEKQSAKWKWGAGEACLMCGCYVDTGVLEVGLVTATLLASSILGWQSDQLIKLPSVLKYTMLVLIYMMLRKCSFTAMLLRVIISRGRRRSR